MTGTIDATWRAANPLPGLSSGLDKEDRGRVLLIGGSRLVPGAMLLTGEASLRAGAGKVQIGTIDAAAIALGTAFPEAAVIGLPIDDTGEIATEAARAVAQYAESCDTLVLGPGMAGRPQTPDLVGRLLNCLGEDATILLDAGAMTCLRVRDGLVSRLGARGAVLTPHHGELAALTGVDKAAIAREPERAAIDAARALGAIVVLKSATTFIAGCDGAVLRHESRAPGLGTAGSGDVLAGVIGGLLARGMPPLAAAAWGVWLHAEAGRAAGSAIGETGYLARDLLPHVPRLMMPGQGQPPAG